MAAVLRGLPILLSAAVLAAFAGHQPAAAQQQGYGQTLTGASSGGADPTGSRTGSGKGGSLLDAVNPIDLMNKINRSQAMEDATPPGDAVDAALREFATQAPGAGAAAGPTPSGSLKGP